MDLFQQSTLKLQGCKELGTLEETNMSNGIKALGVIGQIPSNCSFSAGVKPW